VHAVSQDKVNETQKEWDRRRGGGSFGPLARNSVCSEWKYKTI